VHPGAEEVGHVLVRGLPGNGVEAQDLVHAVEGAVLTGVKG
jgi:hypothetical protein